MRALATVQEGVVGIDQLTCVGCDSDQWWRARRNGRWALLTPRVLRLDGAPETDGQRAHAAVLDAGASAVLHGPSTLAWLGVRGFDLGTLHVMRRRGTTSTPCTLATVHRLRQADERYLTSVRGVPTVTPIRAVWSEASRFSATELFERGLQRIGRVLDDLHRANLVTWSELAASVDHLGRRGRAGTRLMRELAAARPPGTSPTESRNEDRLEEILRTAGAAPLRRQRVVGGVAPIGRTDHRDPDLPLVVEVNSLTFHTTPSDRLADERRYAHLVDAGFTVAVIWENDLWSRPSAAVETVTTGRRLARRGDSTVLHSAGCPWPHDPARRIVGNRGRPYRG